MPPGGKARISFADGALLISGRVDYVTTPAPLASPPKHPQRKFSDSLERRGHAARAAGASFPRCARSGDLPPRRVNAIVRFRLGQNPLQPITLYLCRLRPSADPDLPSLERNCSSSLFPELQIPSRSHQTTVLTILGCSVIPSRRFGHISRRHYQVQKESPESNH